MRQCCGWQSGALGNRQGTAQREIHDQDVGWFRLQLRRHVLANCWAEPQFTQIFRVLELPSQVWAPLRHLAESSKGHTRGLSPRLKRSRRKKADVVATWNQPLAERQRWWNIATAVPADEKKSASGGHLDVRRTS